MFNTRKRMKETIDCQAKMIANRDKFISKMSEEQAKLYDRISDLEVQVEFLVNNLSKKKRELIRPEKQD